MKLFDIMRSADHNNGLVKVVSNPFKYHCYDDFCGASIESNFDRILTFDGSQDWQHKIEGVIVYVLSANDFDLVNLDRLTPFDGDVTDGYIPHDIASISASHAAMCRNFSRKLYENRLEK